MTGKNAIVTGFLFLAACGNDFTTPSRGDGGPSLDGSAPDGRVSMPDTGIAADATPSPGDAAPPAPDAGTVGVTSWDGAWRLSWAEGAATCPGTGAVNWDRLVVSLAANTGTFSLTTNPGIGTRTVVVGVTADGRLAFAEWVNGITTVKTTPGVPTSATSFASAVVRDDNGPQGHCQYNWTMTGVR